MTAPLAGLFERQRLLVLGLAAEQILIELAGLFDNPKGKLLVHGFVIVPKLVLGFAIWGLVVPEPGPDLVHLTWELSASKS